MSPRKKTSRTKRIRPLVLLRRNCRTTKKKTRYAPHEKIYTTMRKAGIKPVILSV